MEENDKILEILLKIQNGINFFKTNWEYKKAEVFLRRFEALK
jgi:predicted aldo/keto reductase-like oxidoreductase